MQWCVCLYNYANNTSMRTHAFPATGHLKARDACERLSHFLCRCRCEKRQSCGWQSVNYTFKIINLWHTVPLSVSSCCRRSGLLGPCRWRSLSTPTWCWWRGRTSRADVTSSRVPCSSGSWGSRTVRLHPAHIWSDKFSKNLAGVAERMKEKIKNYKHIGSILTPCRSSVIFSVIGGYLEWGWPTSCCFVSLFHLGINNRLLQWKRGE